MIKKFEEFINEGIMGQLNRHLAGNIDRKSNAIDGVDNNHSFTDANGVFHRRGYEVLVENESSKINILKKLVDSLIEARGNECDLNDIDVSNIKSMSCLFRNSDFNGDISGWDVSNVEDFSQMFEGSKFNNGSINNWKLATDDEKRINMNYMFGGGMNNKKDLSNIDISGWNTNRVTTFCRMFQESNFNGDLSNWDVSNSECFDFMFYKSDFNNESISNWKFLKGFGLRGRFFTAKSMFRNTDMSAVEKLNWNTERMSSTEAMFAHSKFNGDLSSWDVSIVSNFSYMFENSEFNNKSISGWVFGDFQINAKEMFYECECIDLGIKNWDTHNFSDVSFMFKDSNFSEDLSNWSDESMIDTRDMLEGCPADKNRPEWYNPEHFDKFEIYDL